MPFRELPDLASRLLGGGVVACNDEFFAPADNLVLPGAPTFAPKTFGAKGQVYDGWETRRRRTPGHDWAVVRLGVPGTVVGVVVDTAWFTGNFPPYASVEGTFLDGYPSPDELAAAAWQSLVPRSALSGDSLNPFPVGSSAVVSHVRLNIYPDGGVARLRVHGVPVPDKRLFGLGALVDLAATEHGGRVVRASNDFYGNPNNLLLPGFARTMGEGWETARRRDGDNDWVVVALGLPGTVRVAELDTSHFKGNAPGHARLTATTAPSTTAPSTTALSTTAPSTTAPSTTAPSTTALSTTALSTTAPLIWAPGASALDDAEWVEILPRTRLQPDTRHRFVLRTRTPATHVRLDVYPDGGLARLRLLGKPTGQP